MSSDQLTQTSITLPKDLKRKAQVKAILQDTNLSQVIRELLTQWVEENQEPSRAEGNHQVRLERHAAAGR